MRKTRLSVKVFPRQGWLSGPSRSKNREEEDNEVIVPIARFYSRGVKEERTLRLMDQEGLAHETQSRVLSWRVIGKTLFESVQSERMLSLGFLPSPREPVCGLAPRYLMELVEALGEIERSDHELDYRRHSLSVGLECSLETLLMSPGIIEVRSVPWYELRVSESATCPSWRGRRPPASLRRQSR